MYTIQGSLNDNRTKQALLDSFGTYDRQKRPKTKRYRDKSDSEYFGGIDDKNYRK